MAKQQRDPAKEALWRKMLQRFSASGLSVREFCKREGVTESAFYAWRRTIGQRDEAGSLQLSSASRPRRPAFVPAVLGGEAQRDEAIVLALASGMKLHFPPTTPAERVAELVRALQSPVES